MASLPSERYDLIHMIADKKEVSRMVLGRFPDANKSRNTWHVGETCVAEAWRNAHSGTWSLLLMRNAAEDSDKPV